MAHFAKLGINGKVLSVEVVADADCQGADSTELESIGVDFLNRTHGWPLWAKTSYNTRGGKYWNADGTEHSDQSKAFRGNYAGVGYTWYEDHQIFVPSKPFDSWVLDTTNAKWKSPIGDPPALTSEQITQNTPVDTDTPATHYWKYEWNEVTTSWDLKNKLID